MAKSPFSISNKSFMDNFVKAADVGLEVEFLEKAVTVNKRETRVLTKQRDAEIALEKLNRMRRARSMPEVTSL